MTLPLPGDIIVGPPQFSSPTVQTPSTAGVTLVPVAGPVGPQGPPGDAASSMGYVHTQVSPVRLVQINHGLIFKPSAPVCVDTEGRIIDYDIITWPFDGIMEIDFGSNTVFSGSIYVS
jgi:hypothetical protein